ncbi:MAG TPA: hypothetical protein VK212_09350 [Lentimicrobium sp.]|nr:hypothetical protein [Lentimicrobium sp.]
MLKATCLLIFANMENYSETNINFSQIDDAIDHIKHGHNWLSGELGFNILQQNPDSNVLIIAMHDNSEFESFQANNSLVIKVIHGKVRFNLKNKSTIVESGQTIILLEKVFYLIEAIEESVFLLMTFNNFNVAKNQWIC